VPPPVGTALHRARHALLTTLLAATLAPFATLAQDGPVAHYPLDGDGTDRYDPRPVYLRGALDDLRIYDRVLSADEIERLRELEPTPGR
jgi:hypothetical protein